MKTQIIYYSKYGSAKEIAFRIKKKLNADVISDIAELNSINGDLLIIGSSIYSESPDKKILDLLLDEENLLKDKKIALFVVCLAKEERTVREMKIGGPVYLRKMETALKQKPVAAQIFGGRLIPDLLSQEDYKRQEAFYKMRRLTFNAVDMVSSDEIDEFVLKLKDLQ